MTKWLSGNHNDLLSEVYIGKTERARFSTDSEMNDFNQILAIVISINDYQRGIPPLRTTGVGDGRLEELLEQDHGQLPYLRADMR